MGPGDLKSKDHTPNHESIQPESVRPEDIIAEAQRRLQERDPTASTKRDWVKTLNHGVYWLAQHWLALFNLLAGLYTAGAVLAPVFMKTGRQNVGYALYTFYKPFCHQYPFRSWFLFGPKPAYPLTHPISVIQMNQLSAFVGDASTGYKMALCQRDIAMYGIIFLAGILYGKLRAIRSAQSRKAIQPLPMWIYFVFGIIPIMLDGGIQWISYLGWVLFPAWITYPFETIPLMRALTGALFGLGIVATSYPHIDAYFEDVKDLLRQKFNWT